MQPDPQWCPDEPLLVAVEVTVGAGAGAVIVGRGPRSGEANTPSRMLTLSSSILRPWRFCKIHGGQCCAQRGTQS